MPLFLRRLSSATDDSCAQFSLPYDLLSPSCSRTCLCSVQNGHLSRSSYSFSWNVDVALSHSCACLPKSLAWSEYSLGFLITWAYQRFSAHHADFTARVARSPNNLSLMFSVICQAGVRMCWNLLEFSLILRKSTCGSHTAVQTTTQILRIPDARVHDARLQHTLYESHSILVRAHDQTLRYVPNIRFHETSRYSNNNGSCIANVLDARCRTVPWVRHERVCTRDLLFQHHKVVPYWYKVTRKECDNENVRCALENAAQNRFLFAVSLPSQISHVHRPGPHSHSTSRPLRTMRQYKQHQRCVTPWHRLTMTKNTQAFSYRSLFSCVGSYVRKRQENSSCSA